MAISVFDGTIPDMPYRVVVRERLEKVGLVIIKRDGSKIKLPLSVATMFAVHLLATTINMTTNKSIKCCTWTASQLLWGT